MTSEGIFSSSQSTNISNGNFDPKTDVKSILLNNMKLGLFVCV